MSGFWFFIEQISRGLYFFCALGIVIAIRSFIQARRKLADSEFDLERELALRQQARAITWFIGVIEIALMVVAITNVVAPTVRADTLSTGETTPDPSGGGHFQTSIPGSTFVNPQGTPQPGVNIDDQMLTVTAQAAAGDSAPKILLTSTPIATPPGTIVPGMPTPIGCNSDNASLEVPANGQVLFDSVTVIGTANVPNFAFYKFELSGPSTGNVFTPVGGDRTSPVTPKGTLGQLALSQFQPGTYYFRLAVFDNTTMLRASCTVMVILRERPPTPTKVGS